MRLAPFEMRFHASRKPPAGKPAEGRTDANEKEWAAARAGDGHCQLTREVGVPECTERNGGRIEDRLRLIAVGAAGIAHERADDLVDRTGRAAGIAATQ